MGLPIFFEPSTPGAQSERREKPATDARSGIRRRHIPGNGSGAAYNARQLNNIASSRIRTATGTIRDEMSNNHMQDLPGIQYEHGNFRRQRLITGRMETDRPSMPAVPESRDYVTPMNLDSQRPAQGPDPTPQQYRDSSNSISQTRASEVSEERSRATPSSENNVSKRGRSKSVEFNHIEWWICNPCCLGGGTSKSKRRKILYAYAKWLKRGNAKLDENIREERRVQRRLEERLRIEGIRERAEASTRVDNTEREQEQGPELPNLTHAPEDSTPHNPILAEQSESARFEGGEKEQHVKLVKSGNTSHNFVRDRMELARRRVEQAEIERGRARDEVERGGSKSREREARVDRAREQLARADSPGSVYRIAESFVDGLGDRERSLSPEASASSSFASTAATRSQRDSTSTATASSLGSVSRSYQLDVPTNGDCDAGTDLETEDESTGESHLSPRFLLTNQRYFSRRGT
ncbi:hypothetical protein EYC84_005956 [Monilinia fructicola]|uniref:Uncharacterized protein n=1 Tax=Monilinia fructicola TaxID=38448 RepID=A0A5M9K3B7_MONFR|nr:hypothetical protein EYC84_005956 [Monilinia fructicola]